MKSVGCKVQYVAMCEPAIVCSSLVKVGPEGSSGLCEGNLQGFVHSVAGLVHMRASS